MQITRHAQIAQYDEKHGEGVDGGDARLGVMHQVQREGQHRNRRNVTLFGQLQCEQVQRRKHQHPDKRAREAPAERRHAKNRDSDGHHQLTKRRMGGFIGLLSMQMLIGRARVINLVKIGAVIPAGLAHTCILLVDKPIGGLCLAQQIGVCAGMAEKLQGNLVTPLVAGDDFKQVKPSLLGVYAEVFAGEPQHPVRRVVRVLDLTVHLLGLQGVVPPVAKPFPHLAWKGVGPVDAVLANGDGKAVIADTRVIQHAERLRLVQLKRYLLLGRCGYPPILRSDRAAEVGKSKHRV